MPVDLVDVARITTGTIEGNRVTLYNVRNFDWRGKTDYTQRWDTRSYDLDRLRSVDMIMSYWAGPAIAHMLISFGFDDGQYVAFSVEIRRQRTQEFSEIGGFFKDFELSIIAADERDVIRVRTNIRGEEDYLYQLRMPLSAMRSLFLGYVGEANALVDAPRFYNTVTVNCTTLVYQMMKRIVGHLPLDYRLLLSGYLPEYVYSVHGLNHDYSIEELKARGYITERARESDRSPNFSADIRRGLPGVVLPPQQRRVHTHRNERRALRQIITGDLRIAGETARGLACLGHGGDTLRDGGLHRGVHRLADQSHGRRQIRRAEEHAVDAGDGGDGLEVRERRD